MTYCDTDFADESCNRKTIRVFSEEARARNIVDRGKKMEERSELANHTPWTVQI